MQPGLETTVDMAAQGLADAGPAGARLLKAQVSATGGSRRDYWRLKARLLEAQGEGGNWNEDVWPSPSPFYKLVGQLIGLGSRRATSSLISLL